MLMWHLSHISHPGVVLEKVLRGLCASHRESDPMAIHLRSMRAALRVPGLEVPKPNTWLGWGLYCSIYKALYIIYMRMPITITRIQSKVRSFFFSVEIS